MMATQNPIKDMSGGGPSPLQTAYMAPSTNTEMPDTVIIPIVLSLLFIIALMVIAYHPKPV